MVNKIKKIILIVFILINMMSISVLAKTEKYSFQIIDNLSENDLSNEDKISVVIELDYNELDNKEILKDNRIKEKVKKEKVREKNKEYYSKENKNRLSNLNFNYDYIFISDYSPFIFLEFNNYDNYNKEIKKIKNNLNNKEVKRLYIEKKSKFDNSAFQNDIELTDDYNITDAKDDIYVSNSSYNGEGIKVGIIEEYYVRNNYSTNLNYEKIHWNPTYDDIKIDSDKLNHPLLVSNIISGTYGVAPNVDLYYSSCDHMAASIEYMIDEGVDVVNMSIGEKYNFGYYLAISAYIDYISLNNLIIFVVSAGNYETNDRGVDNPGMGINVCSVGSYSQNGNVAYHSNYEVNSSYGDITLKPNLVAPGENIKVPNLGNIKDTGTSFAAPFVTGIIALLLDEFPSLHTQPQVILSSLYASANQVNGQTSLIDEKAGFGLVNYAGARDILSNYSYDYNDVPYYESANTECITKTISVMPNTTVKYNVFIMQRTYSASYPSGNETDHTSLDITNYEVEIYDSSNLVITEQYGVNSNTIAGILINNNSSWKDYTIKIILKERNDSYITQKVGLTYTPHCHTFDNYVEEDSTSHCVYCACGDYEVKNHVLDSLGNCTLCGYYGHIHSFIHLY